MADYDQTVWATFKTIARRSRRPPEIELTEELDRWFIARRQQLALRHELALIPANDSFVPREPPTD